MGNIEIKWAVGTDKQNYFKDKAPDAESVPREIQVLFIKLLGTTIVQDRNAVVQDQNRKYLTKRNRKKKNFCM